MLTRRGFLAFASMVSVRLAVPSVSLALVSGRAHATPMAALPAVQAFLSIMAAFSRGDGGLGAMLQAQHELSHLVVNQLFIVQERLAELRFEVSKLKGEFRDAVLDGLADQLCADILAAASDYRSFLEQAGDSEAFWTNEPVKKSLSTLLERVAKSRGVLRYSATGLSPGAAIHAPIACALETAIAQRLGYPNEFIRARLATYEQWVNDMLSQKPAALSDQIIKAIQSHDAVINKLAKRPIGKNFGIENYAIGKEQEAILGIEHCIVLAVANLVGLPPWTDAADSRLETLTIPYSHMVHGVSSWKTAVIRPTMDEQYGAKLLKYYEVETHYGAIRYKEFGGETPPNGINCYFAGGQFPPHFPWIDADDFESSVRKRIEDGNFLSQFAETNAMLRETIAAANVERARIAYCFGAIVLATAAKARIQESKARYA